MNASDLLRRLTLVGAIAIMGACSRAPASAQEGAMAPTYARTRGDAGDWQSRGGAWPSHGWRGNGYVWPNPYPAVVAQSWYQRPYPYHFDYYRHRWGAAPEGAAAPPTSDCPCEEVTEPGPAL